MDDDGNNFRSLELDAAEALQQQDTGSGQDPVGDSNIFPSEMHLDRPPVQDTHSNKNNNNHNNNNNNDSIGDDDITASEMYMYTRFVNSLATADVPKSEDLPFLQGAPVLDPHQLTGFFHGFQSPHPDTDPGLDVLDHYHGQHDTTITTGTTTTTTATVKRRRNEPGKVRVTAGSADPLNDEIGNLISMSGTSSSGTRSSTAPTSISSPDSTVLSTPASLPNDQRLVTRKHPINISKISGGSVDSRKETDSDYRRQQHHHHHHHHRRHNNHHRRDSNTTGESGENSTPNSNDQDNDSKASSKTKTKTKVKTKSKSKAKVKTQTQTQTQTQIRPETGNVFKNYDIDIPGRDEPKKTKETGNLVNSKTHSGETSGLTEDDEILKELTFASDIRGPEVHVNPLGGEPNKVSETKDQTAQSSASDGSAVKSITGGSNVNVNVNASTEQPYYVNPKQYYRILKRRYARAKLEESLQITKDRKPYLHESRHKHAMRRPRGQGGRFLTAAEIKALKERESQQKTGEGDVGKKSSTDDQSSKQNQGSLKTESTSASSTSGNKSNEIRANIKVEEMKAVSEGGVRQHDTTASSPKTTVTSTTGTTTTNTNSTTNSDTDPGTTG